ncbi:MAG TPA: 4Fe-4S dicluster domain-containing protein [Firmicutes bacterium]|nr:4Fe-4S dicluster domain-containing protein [Bacillota bacterium]
MKELVVISGKGGTGKTSLTASFAALAKSVVIADCDVDAANLHLVMQPETFRREEFFSGHEALIRTKDCIKCGRCKELCRFDAIRFEPEGRIYSVDPYNCEGCGVCVDHCPVSAIDFPERRSGIWSVSRTPYGTMVHAKLDPAGENSGQLVSLVRKEAKEKAREEGKDLVITDGPPGIGCPVIASVTGASLVLIVTEPTLSGLHDMERVLQLTGHFHVPALVCVNKWDLNPEMTARIEEKCLVYNVKSAGRVRYDGGVTGAMVKGRPAVMADIPAAEDIREAWSKVERALTSLTKEET